MNLVELYTEMEKEHNHGAGFTDKGLPYHTYVYLYEEKFKNHRDNVNLLEIGVDHGGSLELWKKYFTKYDITGVDIIDGITGRPYEKSLREDENIDLHLDKDSQDSEFADTFSDGYFDFIIEDGSHEPDIQLETFKVWIHKLKKGGLYFMEDILGYTVYQGLKDSVKDYLDKRGIAYEIEDYYGDTSKLTRMDDMIMIIKLV